ncbi:MAG: hypothetical protein IT236_09865 [Bacteroidia bacterium]|nr:hypothetical protein [Bacteroidia bacterium]
MTDEELKTIINKLDTKHKKAEAIFGIFQYGGGPEECFIRANKSGLQIFAAELLQASVDSKSIIEDTKKKVILLDQDAEWLDDNADVCLQYIEPMDGSRQESLKILNENDSSMQAEVFKIGCILLAVFLFACLCLGIGKMWTIIFG